MGNDNKNANKTFTIFKNVFSKETGQVSTDLGTKHRWVKGIKVVKMKCHTLSQEPKKNEMQNTLVTLTNLFL